MKVLSMKAHTRLKYCDASIVYETTSLKMLSTKFFQQNYVEENTAVENVIRESNSITFLATIILSTKHVTDNSDPKWTAKKSDDQTKKISLLKTVESNCTIKC